MKMEGLDLKRMIKVITLEMKRKNFIKNIVINMVGLMLILLLLLIIDKSIDVSYVLITLTPYIVLTGFCFSLAQEFENKTDKIIFTGIFSRSEIIISKLISFCTMAFVYFIFYEIVSVIFSVYIGQGASDLLNIKTLGNNLYVFLIYAFTLGSFILLVSACTANGIFTGIITYVLYFDLILALLAQALSSSKNEMLKWAIINSPFYNANIGFYNLKYNFNQSMVMIISGSIFLIATCIIINKKNI
jgi:ABC-2 type transport system permease protein